jgi:hypothetical protein
MSRMAQDLNRPHRFGTSPNSGPLGQNRDSAEHVPDADAPLQFAKRPRQAEHTDEL